MSFWQRLIDKSNAGEMTMLEAHKRYSVYHLAKHSGIRHPEEWTMAIAKIALPNIIFAHDDDERADKCWAKHRELVREGKMSVLDALQSYYDEISSKVGIT